ncbi:MAG: Hsp70 family protein [Alphaproteobacteria bacterium]|nr:Hsp70 family protein [Alphaproteobacteria bacterium]
MHRVPFETSIREKTAALTSTAHHCISTAGLRRTDIDGIFFTGGSSRIPAIQDAIARVTPEAQRRTGSDMRSVALGLTQAAAQRVG